MKSVGRSPHRTEQLAALSLIGVALAAQVVGAVMPGVTLLVAATAVGYAVDVFLHWRHQGLVRMLTRIRADVTVRQMLRDLLLITGLFGLGTQDSGTLYFPLFYGLLALYALHFTSLGTAFLVKRARTLPMVTRNIDASALHPTPAPPALLTRHPGLRLLLFGLPATAGLLTTAVTEVPYYAASGIGMSIALSAAGLLTLLARLLPGRRPVATGQALKWLDSWLAEYRPTVGLYFSGGRASAYQANMWLSTMARLDGRPVIILRERFMVQRIAATGIPILCIPKVTHLMRLEKSALRVLIHPANSGKTSQVLRIPTIKHAFVNHGESDKVSSCNPYAKAYDEVWVAGPAARERYALADVGVEDKDIVEVGRPQLAEIEPYTGPPAAAFTTVLYAPTWEGWTDDPGNTSVIAAGENIVRELLADPAVRLLYKPHPMTGTVDPRAARAHQRITKMIGEANRSPAAASPEPAARGELRRREEELDRLTDQGFPSAADELERMSVQSRPAEGHAEAVRAATAAWEAAYWASLPEGEHQVIAGPRPGLYACFNEADLLISDVSSVVSDYLAGEKPYAVTNTGALDEEEFRTAFPTVRAATILAPDAKGVGPLLETVRGTRPDPLAAARRELKEHLLGPSEPPSIVRFREAARALAARAEDRNSRMTARAATSIPVQFPAAEAAEAPRGG